MTASRKNQTTSRIKRKINPRIKRHRKAVGTTGLGMSRTSRRKHPRAVQTSRHVRRASGTKKATRNNRHRRGTSPDLSTRAMGQAIKAEMNAVQIARQVSLTGIDVLESATNLLIAPAILLGASLGGRSKSEKAKILSWPVPTTLEVSVEPATYSAAA